MIPLIDFPSYIADKSIGCEDEAPLKWFLVTSLLPENFHKNDPWVSFWEVIQTSECSKITSLLSLGYNFFFVGDFYVLFNISAMR